MKRTISKRRSNRGTRIPWSLREASSGDSMKRQSDQFVCQLTYRGAEESNHVNHPVNILGPSRSLRPPAFVGSPLLVAENEHTEGQSNSTTAQQHNSATRGCVALRSSVHRESVNSRFKPGRKRWRRQRSIDFHRVSKFSMRDLTGN